MKLGLASVVIALSTPSTSPPLRQPPLRSRSSDRWYDKCSAPALGVGKVKGVRNKLAWGDARVLLLCRPWFKRLVYPRMLGMNHIELKFKRNQV